jgi:diguanylate cyclase (GGDEF)-like protein/PAS domain S-box-containing protein
MFETNDKEESNYITESKKRCINWGMDPSKILRPKSNMTDEELADKKASYLEILDVFASFSKKVTDSLEGTPMLIVLSDENGYLLDTVGDKIIQSTMAQLGITPGCQFSEPDIGTNVISMALIQKHQVQIVAKDHFHKYLQGNACYGVPFRYTDDDNLLGSICIMTDAKLHNKFFIIMLTTLVDSIERELLLRKQNRKLNIMNQIMMSKTRNAIIITDKDGQVVDFNEFAEVISGFSKNEIVGRSIFDSHITGTYFKDVLKNLNKYENVEMKFINNNGEKFICLVDIQQIVDENLKVTGAFGQFRNITERYLAEERYNYLAYHDELTDLPNRRYFTETLSEFIKKRAFEEEDMSLVFIDLDKLKMINDTFGHIKGDLLIKEVTEILKTCLNTGDSIFRIGGDEFVLMCYNIKDNDQAKELGEKIKTAIAKPILIDNVELRITASLGIVLYNATPANLENCLIYADNALFKAKENGRNGYVIYEATLEKLYKDKLILKIALEKALENEEFVLHYQPQVDITSGDIIGVEALIRWNHGEKGMIYPNDFIPLAEEIGLIIQIGEWVIKEACTQLKKWQDMQETPLTVSVNLSAQQFLKNDLVQLIENLLTDVGLDSKHLELELTESMTMEVNHAVEAIKKLNELGVKIAIDDFGTGYSSLNYLKKFSLNHLKIDKSFIHDIENDGGDANIIATIISMAHNLDLKVIAEGVENIEQLSFLKNHMCDYVQGYYFSKPLSADDFENKFYKTQHKFSIL